MAGYIGSKSSVTLVDGYSEAEADAEFVNDPNDVITVSGSNVGIGTSSPTSPLHITGSGHTAVTITAGTSSDAQIRFGDSGDTDSGMINYDNIVNALKFVTNGADRMRIDSSGQLLHGISSMPTGVLLGRQLISSSSTGSEIIAFREDSTVAVGDKCGAFLIGNSDPDGTEDHFVGMWGKASSTNGSQNLHFAAGRSGYEGDAPQMTLDSSGNLLVGTTDAQPPTNSDVSGIALRADGKIAASRNNGISGDFNNNTDGDIIWFRKSGAVVGAIKVFGAGEVTFGSENANGGGLYFTSDKKLLPTVAGSLSDNTVDIGKATIRFQDIYATNGTIQTSDFNEKQDIALLTATEMLVGKRISALFKTFRWKYSVAEKGDNARTHTGVIAQDVQAAFTAEGLDAGDYALFISSTWWETQTEVPAVEAVDEVLDEDGNVTTEAVEAKDAYTRTDTYDTEDEAPEGATSKTRMGIRYPELLSFVAAYNEQRFASIEARLTALEA